MSETPDPSHARERFFNLKIQPIVQNPLVTAAFERVDRRKFIPVGYKDQAYMDFTISIKEGSSMSQPTLMAEMLDFLELTGSERVLEVGTASGYNAALLACCAATVFTVEHDPELAQKAQETLEELKYSNIYVQAGDGAKGLPEQAPFDRIILTAAAREFPQLLFDQLVDKGVIVAPVGETIGTQQLVIGRKKGNMLELKPVFRVGFVELQTSEHGGFSDEALTKKRTYEITELIK